MASTLATVAVRAAMGSTVANLAVGFAGDAAPSRPYVNVPFSGHADAVPMAPGSIEAELLSKFGGGCPSPALCVLLPAAVRRPALARCPRFSWRARQVGLDLSVGLPAAASTGDAVWQRGARQAVATARAVCRLCRRRSSANPAAGLPALREGERVLAVLGAAEVVHVAAVRRPVVLLERRERQAASAAAARGARAGAAGRARSRRTPRWRTHGRRRVPGARARRRRGAVRDGAARRVPRDVRAVRAPPAG